MRRLPAAILAALLSASSASALTYTLSVPFGITGGQETPANASAGSGTLTGTYNDGTNIMMWSGTFTGLTGTTTDAHFHGPSAFGGPAAGVQVPITAAGGGDVFPLGVTSGSYSGMATLTAAQETMLLDGLMYINIHTSFRTAGEIRGQIEAPEPPTIALLLLGLFGLARAGRRRRPL